MAKLAAMDWAGDRGAVVAGGGDAGGGEMDQSADDDGACGAAGARMGAAWGPGQAVSRAV